MVLTLKTHITMEKVQKQFDALVKKHGAAAVIAAVKGHTVQPDGPGNCQTTGCPQHYICNTTTGNCVLDI